MQTVERRAHKRAIRRSPPKTKQIHHKSTKTTPKLLPNPPKDTLCYAIVLPGRKSALLDGFAMGVNMF